MAKINLPKSYEDFEAYFAALEKEDEEGKGRKVRENNAPTGKNKVQERVAEDGLSQKSESTQRTKKEEESAKEHGISEDARVLLRALQETGLQAKDVPSALQELQRLRQAVLQKSTEMRRKSGQEANVNPTMGGVQAQGALPNDELQRQMGLHTAKALFLADKAAVEHLDPGFFSSANEEQLRVFGALRFSGLDALTAYSYVVGRNKSPSTQNNTGHMVGTRGRASQSTEVPRSVLKEFEAYGIHGDKAKKHYEWLGGAGVR